MTLKMRRLPKLKSSTVNPSSVDQSVPVPTLAAGTDTYWVVAFYPSPNRMKVSQFGSLAFCLDFARTHALCGARIELEPSWAHRRAGAA